MSENQPRAAHNAFSARRIMRLAISAALATLDARTGSPYASLVTVATAIDATPILLISDLAQHRRNIEADPRASLLFDGTVGHDDPLEGSRVSVMGRAVESGDDTHRRRFLARHPRAHYADFADFDFFQIEIERAHLVAGFGRVHWIEGQNLRLVEATVADLEKTESEIVAHMNNDHADAIELYATALLGAAPGAWRMTAIDPEGADLALDSERLRLDFREPVCSPTAARDVLVALVREARTEAAGKPS